MVEVQMVVAAAVAKVQWEESGERKVVRMVASGQAGAGRRTRAVSRGQVIWLARSSHDHQSCWPGAELII